MIHTHLRNNIVGYLALFIALSASAYAAGLERDSVKSRHIKDGKVRSADVRDADLTGTDVAAGSLGSLQVGDDQLSGNDIAESSLGTVPSALVATQGGLGRQASTGDSGAYCDPEDSAFQQCATVQVTSPVAGRALVIGQVRANTENASDSEEGHGFCRLGSSAVNPIDGTTTHFGVEDDDDVGDSEHSTIFGITPTLSPGTHTFGIDCSQTAPGAIEYHGGRVAVVMLGPG